MKKLSNGQINKIAKQKSKQFRKSNPDTSLIEMSAHVLNLVEESIHEAIQLSKAKKKPKERLKYVQVKRGRHNAGKVGIVTHIDKYADCMVWFPSGQMKEYSIKSLKPIDEESYLNNSGVRFGHINPLNEVEKAMQRNNGISVQQFCNSFELSDKDKELYQKAIDGIAKGELKPLPKFDSTDISEIKEKLAKAIDKHKDSFCKLKSIDVFYEWREDHDKPTLVSKTTKENY